MSRTFQVGDRVLNECAASRYLGREGTVLHVEPETRVSYRKTHVRWESAAYTHDYTSAFSQHFKLINQSQSINLTKEVIL